MNSKLFNLPFLILWVTLGVGMLLRDWWMPDDLRKRISDENAQLVMLVAAVFAAWNVTRLLAARRMASDRPSPEVEAYRRKIRAMSGQDPKVTDPQFKFDDPPADAPPPGEHPA